jgi:multidrug efflux pump subunit AcrA (membrane-fusion protein)
MLDTPETPSAHPRRAPHMPVRPGRRRHARTGRSGKILLPGALVVLLLAGIIGGWMFLNDDRGGAADRAADLHEVTRGRFEVVIPTSGELAAVRQVEVVNRLESRSIITEIVNEGSIVRKGDLLFRLADEEIRNRIKDAEDALTAAEANAAAAESNLAIRMSAAESDIDKADLQIRLARLSLEAWENGELPSRRQSLAVAKETAEINYERLRNKWIESQELLEDDHISRDEFERDRIAMIEAEARLKTAILDIDVYEN